MKISWVLVTVPLLGLFATTASALSGMNLSEWLALQRQNIEEKTNEAVLGLPPDQLEIDYLLQRGINLLTPRDFQALRKLQLSAIEPIVNKHARQILQRPSFAPKDVNLLSFSLYDNDPMVPAAAHPITEVQLRAEVLLTLTKRFRGNLIRVGQAMAVYDDPQVKRVLADSQLRAALAMLKGTVGEGAIDGIKSSVFSSVEFGDTFVGGLDLRALSAPDGSGKQKIIINEKYQFEDPKLLAAVLSHEVLHQDAADSNKEELANNAIEAAVYGQLINEDPGVARSGTELARRENTSLMALVNSRDAQGKIHILSSHTDNVYPGSLAPPLPYFGYGFVINGLGPDTPGNVSLDEDLSAIDGTEISGANFDQNTLNLLDSDIDAVFTPSEWVRLALILKLDVKG